MKGIWRSAALLSWHGGTATRERFRLFTLGAAMGWFLYVLVTTFLFG
jgi:hypothetical protein